VTIGTTVGLLVLLIAFVRGTKYGVQMRAASQDFEMARYLGIHGNFVISLAFAISGVLASVVSLLLVAQTGVISPAVGVAIVLYAFIATVVGGMGSLVGAVIGALLVGTASSFLQAYLPVDVRSFRDAFLFGIVIVLLSLQPSGLIKVDAFQERV
jgi:branched-chain amino acid transport system permease protein